MIDLTLGGWQAYGVDYSSLHPHVTAVLVLTL